MTTFTGLCIGGPRDNQAMTSSRPRVYVPKPASPPPLRLGAMKDEPVTYIMGYYDHHENNRWYWTPT